MTNKERWMASFRSQPVDRLLFFAKLDVAYPVSGYRQEKWKGKDVKEMHKYVGSNTVHGIPVVSKAVNKISSVRKVQKGNDHYEYIDIKMPSGKTYTLDSMRRFDRDSMSYHPLVFPAKTVEDIKWMTEYYLDQKLVLDKEALENANQIYKEIGDDEPIQSCLGESPLMYFIEFIANMPNAHYFLADYKDEVEALFDARHQYLIQLAEIDAEYSPADVFAYSENTSTTLITPDQYAKYCFKHLSDYAKIIRTSGKASYLHMCGHLKGLLDQLNLVDFDAFEAFTTPTVGNTTLNDGRAGCPNKGLIGGTNAAWWLLPEDEIIAKIKDQLDNLPHHRGIVVSSAGVMPPMASLDKIKAVSDFVTSYKVIN